MPQSLPYRDRAAGERTAPGQNGPMIARMHHLVLDCPDPGALAEFYSAVLGKPITYRTDSFVVVADDTSTSGLAFQLAPDHQPPDWPDPNRPQQLHLDLMVNDPAAARDWVIGLGARPLTGPDGTDSVYADPAGHPFCLIRRPSWAAELPD
jgi:catechol 2,3-dioxygenase-like lactoylglutathione lyase family enzyme